MRGNAAKLAATKYKDKVWGDFAHIGWQHAQLPAGLNVADAFIHYRNDPDVLATDVNYICTNGFGSVTPNDTQLKRGISRPVVQMSSSPS